VSHRLDCYLATLSINGGLLLSRKMAESIKSPFIAACSKNEDLIEVFRTISSESFFPLKETWFYYGFSHWELNLEACKCSGSKEVKSHHKCVAFAETFPFGDMVTFRSQNIMDAWKLISNRKQDPKAQVWREEGKTPCLCK